MRELFYRCFNFEGLGLENWDTQSLESLHYTFYDCYKFNGKIGNWNTKKLKNISHTFAECTVFNQDLNNWDVSNVEKLMNVFYKCKSLKTKPDWYWKLKNKSKN
jgi:surface protein